MRQQVRTAGLAAAVFAVDGAFLLVFLVALPVYLVDDLGARESLASFTFAAFGASRLVFQLVSGAVSDRLGAGRAAAGGVMLGAVVVGLMASIDIPWVFPLLAAGYGVGGAVFWPAVFASLATALPEHERGRAASMLALTTALAGAAALLGGSFITDGAGGRVSLVVGVGLLVVGAVFARSSMSSMAAPADHRPPVDVRGVARLMRQRLPLVVVFVVQAAALGAVVPSATRYGLDVLQIQLHEFALLLIPAAFTAAGAVVLGGWLSDRQGRAPVAVAGFAAAAVGFAAMHAFAEPGAFVLAAIVAGGGYALAVPALNAGMMDSVGGPRPGLMTGWIMVAEGAGQALGPALGGIALETGGVLAVLDLAVVLLVLAAVVGVRMTASLPESAPGGIVDV